MVEPGSQDLLDGPDGARGGPAVRLVGLLGFLDVFPGDLRRSALDGDFGLLFAVVIGESVVRPRQVDGFELEQLVLGRGRRL